MNVITIFFILVSIANFIGCIYYLVSSNISLSIFCGFGALLSILKVLSDKEKLKAKKDTIKQ
ncbi:hypothetical protein [Vallitalea sp.]|jgi:hypothetical protein|uniref:hypothetical protein n=1 Tax=Vallitalea sp. TaxID=1882829 RepID=UPI00260004EA|nr:hypothetical protein [Vallitalea sp.]MCT4687131.1 hypothetical protein [Vallitalea sp.]